MTDSNDPTPPIDRRIIEYWRTAPPWQKLKAIDELNETLKLLALSDLRRRYPNASASELQRRLAERWLGKEVAARVYGPIAADDETGVS